jgi:glyoxylase-like metal-dependent hydrolase (beta-lactamase superfamily II)
MIPLQQMRSLLLPLLLVMSPVCNAGSAAADEVSYPPVGVDMPLRQVSKHVYYVEGTPGAATDNEGFISNAGFVVTGAGVVVFDALGSPSLANALLDKIRSVTDEPIVRVIVSHYHADHIYGLQVFEDLDAEILAPVGAGEYLASDNARERLEDRRFTLDPWVNETTRLVYPDRYLAEGTNFRLGDVDFTVTMVGAAHSDGDLTLFVEPDRVLFSGDVIFEGRVPFLGDANTRHWLRVLERMEREQLVALVPGHGSVAADPNAAVRLTRRYLAFLRERMGNAVDEFIPFSEAYNATDWSEFADLPAFAEANRRNAYQVYLSMEAEALGK